MDEANILDYTLNNPDTLTKYKAAAEISHKVLQAVTGRLLAGLCDVSTNCGQYSVKKGRRSCRFANRVTNYCKKRYRKYSRERRF